MRRKFLPLLFAAAVALGCGAFAACAKKPAATPEEAFFGFQKAMVFNRRDDLKRYAAEEYIKQLENVFDLMVVSAQWPSNASIKERLIEGDRAAVKAAGVMRAGNFPAVGAFKLEKRGGAWMVVGGDWITPSEYVKDVVSVGDKAYRAIVDEITGKAPAPMENPWPAGQPD